MNHLRLISKPTSKPTALAVAWSKKVLLLAALVIVVATLYPFKFNLEDSSLKFFIQRIALNSSYPDVLANIVLFIPLGFGLGSVLAKRDYRLLVKLSAVALICGGFSLLIEVLQIFLPDRGPTPLDVVSNTVGGMVGFFIFYYAGILLYRSVAIATQRSRQLLSMISLKYLLLALVAYLMLAGWLVTSWESSSLKNWYEQYPLAIGNNYSVYDSRLGREVNTAWKGSVADLIIRDRTVPQSQVEEFFTRLQSFPLRDEATIAAYSLRGEQGTQDLVRLSPDLQWQGSPSHLTTERGALLSGDHWLSSAHPMDFGVNRIRETSQFTISALITADDTNNPVSVYRSILGIAYPKGFGNLTLTRNEALHRVLVSVRQRKIGQNRKGNRPHSLSIPDVFQDDQPHRLLITYSSFVTRVYVDSVNQMYVVDMTPNRYLVMLSLLILLPLALLVVLIASRVRHQTWLYISTIAVGTLLPPLMLEVYLATQGDRPIRPVNLMLGLLIVGGTILISRTNARSSRQFATSSH